MAKKVGITLVAVGYVTATIYFASAFDAMEVRYCRQEVRSSWLANFILGFSWPAFVPAVIGVEAWSKDGGRWRKCGGQ